MAKFLDQTGLAYFWGKLKVLIPTKTSELTNDSGYLTSPNIPYLTCATAAGTAAKTTTLVSGKFTSADLVAGAQVLVKFTYANSVANPTISINGTTAKSIKRYGTTAPSTSATSSWNANEVVLLVYDGTYWMLEGWINTTYSAMSEAEMKAGTSTTSRLITPARLKEAVAEWETGGVDFAIVNSLPTTDIDESKVYLISTNFDPSTYTPVTYTLSRSGSTIVLTGSNGSVTSADAGLTSTQVEDLIDETINDVLGVSY